MKNNLCDYAHCNHAHGSLLARLVWALTPWAIVRCCVCRRLSVRRQRTPIVKL